LKLTDESIRTLPQIFAQRTKPLNRAIINFSMVPTITDSAVAKVVSEFEPLQGKIQKLWLEFVSIPRRSESVKASAVGHTRLFTCPEINF